MTKENESSEKYVLVSVPICVKEEKVIKTKRIKVALPYRIPYQHCNAFWWMDLQDLLCNVGEIYQFNGKGCRELKIGTKKELLGDYEYIWENE